MRCIYESLALKYRYAIEQLSAVTGRAFTTLHVLGGGTKRPSALPDDGRLLRPYSKGRPGGSYGARQHYDSVESLGVAGLHHTKGRRLIAETEVIKTYTPSTQNYAEWNAAYDRFKTLL